MLDQIEIIYICQYLSMYCQHINKFGYWSVDKLYIIINVSCLENTVKGVHDVF